ncbi:putative ABC transporter [Trypanosoma conorhini]|uniref:Putative ABC transporter n=1 Tax=Trypanosoma conorhini TaxID=83891 RepID=A0A3R7PRW9_9TRYP|nr:putative ABC transporter [Trypanosoma conorhini]RNF24312.1 putative ABC transporter [Trypanosoma conorhini]
MLDGDLRAATPEDSPYGSDGLRESGRGGRGRCVGLFFCQLSALLWKEYLERARRPWKATVELLTPALLILVLAYAVGLSPVVWIEPFHHSRLPEVTLRQGVPNEGVVSPEWEKDVAAVKQWRGVFAALNTTSFFVDYVLTLAALRDVAEGDYHNDPAGVLWNATTLRQEVARALLTNRYAASPFKVPTLDGYTSMVKAARVAIGERGMKHTMHDDPLIQFIIYFGKLAFTIAERGNAELAEAAERLIEYLNVTTKSFAATVLCHYDIAGEENSSCVFDNASRFASLLRRPRLWQGQALWALVRLDRLTVQPPEFRYTIFVNETLLQTQAPVEAFSQGLGKDYANYAYNGVLSLQYELNTYFTSLAAPPRARQNMSLTPLVDYVCSAAPTAHNATANMFAEPMDVDQRELVEKAAAKGPIVTLHPRPFTSVNAIYAPCLYEVGAFCEDANTTKSFLKCLEEVDARGETSSVCHTALKFVTKCPLPNTTACGKGDAYQLLRDVPSALPECAESLAPSCTEDSFLQKVKQTKSVLSCHADLMRLCGPGFHSRSVLNDCIKLVRQTAEPLSEECRRVFASFLPCEDEYESICPWGKSGGKEVIPYACLYENSILLSLRCKTTQFVKDILPDLFSNEAVRETVPAATHYCREVHDVYKTLVSSVVAQAFPTTGYYQELFFLTGGHFLGLVLAIAYYFPFAATVQSIARERETWQRKYLILIGTNPAAILLSKFVTAVIVATIASLFVTFAMAFCVGIPSYVVFNLLYLYSLSLSALAAAVGAVVPGERAATLTAPFILLLSVAPALVDGRPTELAGASMLLPPAALAKAIAQYAKAAQVGQRHPTQPGTFQRALWILFGLTAMYGLLAALLEYLFIPNSALERLLRRCASCVGRLEDYLEQRSRHIVRYYEGEEMTSGVALTRVRQHDGETHDGGGARRSKQEFNIAGVHGTPAGDAAEGRQLIDVNSLSEGAGPPLRAVSTTQEAGAPAESSTAQGAAAAPETHVSLPVPSGWHAAITVRHLCHTAVGHGRWLRVHRADFYQNRLNCIVGGSVSGKSRLLETLMGSSDLPAGEVRIDGKNIWSCQRDDIGVCLYRSVFWDHLTVAENIRLIQLLKGFISDPVEAGVEEDILVSALQLTDVRQERAVRLTTGVARKLSVAMAFAGGSRTLFFDEPTAFTDVSSRHEIWHLLSQNAKGRCIVVSTSDVEDVGVFAEHITVLFDGGLALAGTPDHIRWKLRGGWVVTVCRAENTDISAMLNHVRSLAPDAIVVSNVGREISFQVVESVAIQTLPVLLTELRSARESGAITNITVSDARLSESFVRLTRVLQLRESGGANTPPTEVADWNGDYVMLPSSTENEVAGEGAVERSRVGSTEERASRGRRSFIRTYLTLFGYRAFEAFLGTHYGLLVMLVPLLSLLVGTASLGKRFDSDRLGAASLFNWQLSSDPSTIFYIDVNASGSPYESIAGQLSSISIPNTQSKFSLVNVTSLSPIEHSSVGLDHFLMESRASMDAFAFGAFALQGPIVRVLNSTAWPSLFPWVADVVLCNTSYPLSLPAHLEILGMLRLWAARNETAGVISASIGVVGELGFGGEANHTFPSIAVDVMGTLLMLLPFAFYGSRMVAALVEQRHSGLLQVLYSSSLRPAAFWLANFTYDFVTFFILVLITALFIAFGDISRGVGVGGFFAIMGAMLVFGCSTIMLSYVLSRCFNNAIAAQTFVTAFTIFTGFAFLISSSTVRFLPENPVTWAAKSWNEKFSVLMRFLPLYNLGESLMNYLSSRTFDEDLQVLIRLQPFMFFTFTFVLMLLYESFAAVSVCVFLRDKLRPLLHKLGRKAVRLLCPCHNDCNEVCGDESLHRWEDPSRLLANEDASVAVEREKKSAVEDVRASTLWKLCHDVYALQNVTFSLRSEVLVVVGINGSGKTTLLRCLSGEVLPSHGDVFLRGRCTTRQVAAKLTASAAIGYATEALILRHSNLTPYLFLNIMADLRLLKRDLGRKQHLIYLIRALGIWSSMHVAMRMLNATVQRRVGLAAALVGYPPLLVLDDVTESLDPCSRRHVWAAIQSAPQGTTTVFSSRSPDDVEMLGDRVLVLDEGMMRFIGTPAEWRGTHREGLDVSIDVSRLQDTCGFGSSQYPGAVEKLQKFFTSHWPDSLLIDCRPFHYVFHIPYLVCEKDATGTALPAPGRRGRVFSQARAIRTVLATLVQGRADGWTLPEAREESAKTGESGTCFPCYITISETSIERTMQTSFGESLAFRTAARGLHDRNVRVNPRK